MATGRGHPGGPSHSKRDEPTVDRDQRNAASRDELKERTAERHGRPGRGKRNGSIKQRHG